MTLALALLLQAVASSAAAAPSPIVVNQRLDYDNVSGRDGNGRRSLTTRKIVVICT